ncbi:DESIGUAL/Modifying wall lignin-1/2 [Dillenia turbinata]|uniref:DESIGUAL/Modifying wall lignin-1/2 n=1 Tax=Dillenia turbinata TaxID=194707 RepID=A0AAN8V039_9MAGN
MDKKEKVICCFVGLAGLLAAALAFGAEGTREDKSPDADIPDTDCEFPTTESTTLGLVAAHALLFAQLYVSIAAKCCCHKGPRPSNSRWKPALCSFVVSWVICVIVFLFLLTADVLNNQRGGESTDSDYFFCLVRPGVFSVAGILSLITVALGIFYFISVSRRKNELSTWAHPAVPSQAGIALGQPQFPQPTAPTIQGPVFVHEDTHMRRQYA